MPATRARPPPGKSSAAFGMAIRSIGWGMRVAILDVSASELSAAEQALGAAARTEAAPVPAEAPRRQRESRSRVEVLARHALQHGDVSCDVCISAGSVLSWLRSALSDVSRTMRPIASGTCVPGWGRGTHVGT